MVQKQMSEKLWKKGKKIIRINYKINELDCVEEVSLLKKVLGNQEGIQSLEFDILHSIMSVTFDSKVISSNEIVALIHSIGMRAMIQGKQAEVKRRGRLILTFASGFALLFGIIGHLYFFNPLLIKFFYFLSILFGIVYVLPKAYFSLKRLSPDMNLLMVIAVIGAIGIQEWLEGATVAFLFSLALVLEQWSVGRARRAISALIELSPSRARVIDPKSKKLKRVDIKEIEVGQTVMIRPGEKIPLDGVVVKGSSFVNQAPITGESRPIEKDVGDELFAGTLNTDGALECLVKKRAPDTVLANMIRLVEQARLKRSESEQWVETFAHYYTPLMLLFSLLVMVVPPLFFSALFFDWIYRGLVLLVIACPCALVISTPVSIVSGLTAAARQGILIKGGVFLEEVGQLRALAFDKTGTLTCGNPEVQKIIPLNGHTESELLERAVALEKSSEHPLAYAILRKGKERGIKAQIATNYQAIKGKGALATYQGKLYWIGSHRFMHEMKQETEAIHQQALALEDAGHSIVAIGTDAHVCGLISIADTPKSYIKETISAIRQAGIEEIVMLTGDNEPTARALAVLSGVDHFHAELLPEEKMEAVIALSKIWGKVGMVGDGINDAASMASAFIGIAMGGMGTDVAIETADIVLMSDDLSKLPWLLRYSRRVLRLIKQNISFALGIKALFILLALMDLSTLWMAIVADTGATILVIFNALRLLIPLPE